MVSTKFLFTNSIYQLYVLKKNHSLKTLCKDVILFSCFDRNTSNNGAFMFRNRFNHLKFAANRVPRQNFRLSREVNGEEKVNEGKLMKPAKVRMGQMSQPSNVFVKSLFQEGMTSAQSCDSNCECQCSNRDKDFSDFICKEHK